jgi:Bacterial PH domain
MTDVFVAKKHDKETDHSKSEELTHSHIKAQSDVHKHSPSASSDSSHKKETPISLSESSHIPDVPKGSPFSSFCYYPKNVKFKFKEKEEFIVLLLRRHPITNISWIVIAILMVFAPSVVTSFSSFEMVPMEFQIILLVIWYMITTAFVLEKSLSWFYHVNIVTDERILEVDFVSFLHRELTDANIDQIQDVTVEMGGVFQTFFNFGDIVIQTAGEVPKIRFEQVPNPDGVATILRKLRVDEEREKLEGRVR